ncbi:MAG TPA: hypothetical protein VJI15_03805 [Candidatus Nanoarchaeia archaeon]|nr:hypothetical protein [Candidatus Nanoarchaeia archaeon]
MGVLYQATKNISFSLLRGLCPTDLGELLDKAKRLSDEGCLIERVDVVPQVVESSYQNNIFWIVPTSIEYFLTFRMLIEYRPDVVLREPAGVHLLSYDIGDIAETEARLMRKANDAALRIGKEGFNSRVVEDWERPAMERYDDYLRK